MSRLSTPFLLAPFCLGTLALLAACAAPQGQYPSLAVRDVERMSGTMEVEPAPPPPAPPASTLAELGALAAQARAAQQAFAALAPTARSTVAAAAGQGPGSENWSRAQIAVAELESRRSQAMIALADLDRLYVAAAAEGLELAHIATVRDEVELLVTQQNALIDSLLGALAS